MVAARPTKHQQRCEVVRERVEDWLGNHGANRGPAYREDVQKMFVRRAIRAGKDRGLRLWVEPERTLQENIALNSLKYLLREKKSVRKGKTTTGTNDGWVLDLWEAAIDEITRATPLQRRTTDPARVQIEGDLEHGVEVFVVEHEARPIATRLLEAYIERDDEAMMGIALEVERLETRKLRIERSPIARALSS